MMVVTIGEAGARLAGLIDLAKRGEDVVITRDDVPVARLVCEVPRRPSPRRGTARGLVLRMADDFDAPLADFKEYMQ
ncbi:MAG: type II toxin-antitoxin system prevent-host-death family antitoxin [Armatimonadetes bacterium]|nr:type II toxin-antitoxin system prevent-host-death family antitoxin [Armatimonadota bacterium]